MTLWVLLPYLLTLIIIYYAGKARNLPCKYNIKAVFCPRTSLNRDPSEELRVKKDFSHHDIVSVTEPHLSTHHSTYLFGK